VQKSVDFTNFYNCMLSNYKTVDDHKELLEEKGYLDQNFMTASQAGYWLDEFQAQFDQSYQQSHLAGEPSRFMMDLWGRFNDHLDAVHYTLRYKYDPETERLSLVSVHTRLGKIAKTFYLGEKDVLPSAQDVYTRLAKPAQLENYQSLYHRLAREFLQDRDPGNDYQPDQAASRDRREIRDQEHRPRLRLRR
jgi:hypothetical protein